MIFTYPTMTSAYLIDELHRHDVYLIHDMD